MPVPDVSIHINTPGITAEMLFSPVPEDQSALVASLQTQVSDLTNQLASVGAERDALVAKLATVKGDLDKAETDIG
jgi:hypothetical protein